MYLLTPFPFESKIKIVFFLLSIAEFPYVPFKYREETRREAAPCCAAQSIV